MEGYYTYIFIAIKYYIQVNLYIIFSRHNQMKSTTLSESVHCAGLSVQPGFGRGFVSPELTITCYVILYLHLSLNVQL